jgi:hypothetical protein
MESAPMYSVHRKSKRGRRSKLITLLSGKAEAYSKMLAFIRAGAFACDAASLLGIAPETFCRWMARGALERRGIYRQFRQEVEQAQAVARCTAEIEVRRLNPLAWLRLGPGRTRPGLPGWTDLPKGHQNDPEVVREPSATKQPIVECSRNPLADTFKLAEEAGLISVTPAGREMMKIGTSGESADYDDNGQAAPE